MRCIQIEVHPLSMVMGALVTTAGLLFMSSASNVHGGFQRVAVVNPLAVQGIPAGRDYVRIVEGQPYTVPTSKRLILTGFGAALGNLSLLDLMIDGQTEIQVAARTTGGFTRNLPPGFVVDSGSIVDLAQIGGTSTPIGRAWGYLVDS